MGRAPRGGRREPPGGSEPLARHAFVQALHIPRRRSRFPPRPGEQALRGHAVPQRPRVAPLPVGFPHPLLSQDALALGRRLEELETHRRRVPDPCAQHGRGLRRLDAVHPFPGLVPDRGGEFQIVVYPVSLA